MVTYREAAQRAMINGCRIRKTGYGDYEVFNSKWSRDERDRCAYFTDDLEDAMLTSAKLAA